MSALIKSSELVIIPGSGHIPCVEQPDAVIAAIRQFLSTHNLLPAS